ncbi:hypothetical protein PENTCL1PPCAC_1182, partial [Pristionchus entomophagus]
RHHDHQSAAVSEKLAKRIDLFFVEFRSWRRNDEEAVVDEGPIGDFVRVRFHCPFAPQLLHESSESTEHIELLLLALV